MENKELEHVVPDYDSFFALLTQKFGEDYDYTFEEIDQCISEHPYQSNEWLYETFMYYFLERTTGDYYRYTDPTQYLVQVIDILKKYADILDSSYYYAVYYFFSGDYAKCMEYLAKQIHAQECDDKPYDVTDIALDYLAIFKNGFPGFWNNLANIFKDVNCVSYMQDLLKAIGDFYESEDGELVKQELIEVGRYIEDGFLINELLGICYAEDKMWKNATAYYSMVKERAVLFYDTLYFDTAFAASKCKNHDKSIKYYEMCLDINRYYPYAMNNYGYELYRAHRYEEAKGTFEQLLKDEELQDLNGLNFIVNNYARVLLALKMYDAAKRFSENSPRKIGKDILERIEKANNSTLEEDLELDPGDDSEDTSEKTRQVSAKHTQFSTEKLLEDELEARLLNWDTVFGCKLKMYDHDDDLYGRQYVIPVGRLDLLCEDEDGNYWIIELKKDSGYDDAFAQTMDYIKWFEENKVKDNQKVFGIICLNGPSKELVEKVKKEPRIKLFEYNISYNEVT